VLPRERGEVLDGHAVNPRSALVRLHALPRGGKVFRFKAVSLAEAQAEFRKSAELLRTLPDRLQPIENFDLNIEALHDANVAGAAVSAIDAATWSP
jgi:hypothetical protein